MLETIIGAGGSLLGGLLGRSKSIAPSTQSYGNVKGLMMAAEKYGINPLTLIGGGVSGGAGVPGDNSSMGAGIANAALMLGEGLGKKRAEQAKLNALAVRNDQLQRKVERLTLRAPTPGIYGPQNGPLVTNTGSPSMGGPDRGGPSRYGPTVPTGALPPVITSDITDPRREVEVKATGNSSGVMIVDNPWLGGPIRFPTIDGDEPVDLLDIPSAMMLLPQLAYNNGWAMSMGGGRESRPKITRAEAIKLRDARNKNKRKSAWGPPKNWAENYAW